MNYNRFLSNKTAFVKFVLRALGYRNYRIFFAGQGISLTGSWMQIITVSWLVYRLTNSAFLLGIVGFIGQIPAFILSPFAGVFADRGSRKRIILVTQTLAMIQAFILAVLAFKGVIAVWHIVVLSIFMGLVNAFDMPTRQAFVVDMVTNKEDLGNAIALNSFIFNAARLVGTSAAGIIIAVTSEGMCFLINGISFLAVIFALLSMKIKTIKTKYEKKHILYELKEGFIYVFNFLPIRYILLLVSLVNLVGMSYAIIMPVFTKDILMGGPRTLGFLMGGAGLGALCGAFYLASRKDTFGLEKIILLSTFIFGTTLIIFSFSRLMWLSLLLMLCAGFGLMSQIVSSNTLLQNIVQDDKRGRVMSFYTLSFIGIAPFGNLMAGSLASKIGAPKTLLISGFVCILGALFFLSRFSIIKREIKLKNNAS